MKRNAILATYAALLCFLTAQLSAEPEEQTPVAGTPVIHGRLSSVDFEISKGKLLTEDLAGSSIKQTNNVDATLQNVVQVLRELYPSSSINLAPGLESTRIGDLKLRLNSMPLTDVLQAMELASGSKFEVKGSKMWFMLAPAPQRSSRKTEVFNLSGYLQSLEDRDENSVAASIDQVKDLILQTYHELKPSETARPSFQFHPGANLLIVIGEPEVLEVASKVVNALQPPPTVLGGLGGGIYLPKPAGMSKQRRAIMKKLESIQTSSVRFDGLPLSDVVEWLVQESKALDPEKQGINFFINPNQPAPGPGGTTVVTVDPATGLPVQSQRPEPVDLNAAVIRVTPALKQVRLIDALDAIVRVADHPLKYTITDYAVVFSLRSPGEPADVFGGFPGAAGR
jgi:hypothetical protein